MKKVVAITVFTVMLPITAISEVVQYIADNTDLENLEMEITS